MSDELEQKLIFPNRYTAAKRGRFVTTNQGQESRTVQSYKDECNINTIMRRYLQTGLVPSARGRPTYDDYSTVGDFQSAQETLQRSKELFGSLPSHLRDRFNNSPLEMLGFVHDEKNREEAQKLGLLREPAPRTDPAPVPPAPRAGDKGGT